MDIAAFPPCCQVARSQAHWKRVDDQTRSSLVEMLRADASKHSQLPGWLRLHLISEVRWSRAV